MTSILTNVSAMAALQTLRAIDTDMTATQREVSTGLRVQTASDNAAYWSIATTMRSDNMAISAVSDALGLGAAKVDIAYAATESTVDVLTEFRARLVAAKEDGLDRWKVQGELNQLKDQLLSIASSASFNGVNWLSTDRLQSLWELPPLSTDVTSSFIRSPEGSVRIDKTIVALNDIVLFNAAGGGTLQKDPRSVGDLGGFRDADLNAYSHKGVQAYDMTGSVILTPGDVVEVTLTIDGDGPKVISFNKATIDSVLGTSDGLISNIDDYVAVLNQAIVDAGLTSEVSVYKTAYPYSGGFAIGLRSEEGTGSIYSSISLTSAIHSGGGPTGGLEAPAFTADGDYAFDQFTFTGPFRVYRDVVFSFDVSVNGSLPQTVTIDRELIDLSLGTSDGLIASETDLAKVLNAALSPLGLIVTPDSGKVAFQVNPTTHPMMGEKSKLLIGNVMANVRNPGPDFDIVEVDITDPLNDLDNYLTGVDLMLEKVISGASALGSIKHRIEKQQDFTSTLADSIDKGIGRLVDADMNEASSRLKALQTQEQLAIQSLSIANSNSENIMQLFR